MLSSEIGEVMTFCDTPMIPKGEIVFSLAPLRREVRQLGQTQSSIPEAHRGFGLMSLD